MEQVVGAKASLAVPRTTAVSMTRELESFAFVEVVDDRDTIWCVKSDAEQQILAEIATGVQYGIARAETVLAEATIRGEEVRWGGAELTAERFRR